ncbi:MAG: tRNA (adenosine(37)-N6)-threonylcarbamoyltransferase complex ATPase subunit type 1 TsaE, partial [Nevskiales bacterium]
MNDSGFTLADAAATERLGAALASALGEGGAVIYLRGELGTGKTTLTRALLQRLGHTGRVRSPTYTLVEPYEIGTRRAYHLDLYRLSAAEELEY